MLALLVLVGIGYVLGSMHQKIRSLRGDRGMIARLRSSRRVPPARVDQVDAYAVAGDRD